jgi:hypothetical protein
MALGSWDLRHRESQLLKNLGTATHIMTMDATFVTAGRLFEVTINGTMIRLITDQTGVVLIR